MLFLLRNIRRKMLQNNKVITYLLYATGEIILVVIGILIAVSIDDWNENAKKQKIERDLLHALHIEFQENLNTLYKRQLGNDSAVNYMSNVLQLMSQSIDLPLNENQFDSILLHAISDIIWLPSEYTIQRVSSLSQEEHSELLVLLYDWSRNMATLKEIETNSTKAINLTMVYIKEHGSLRNIDARGILLPEGLSKISKGNLHLLSDPVFENIMDDALVYTRQKSKAYETSVTKIDAILKLTANQ